MRRRRSTRQLLVEALEHLRAVEAYAHHDLTEQLVIDAVCMRLSAAVEVLAAVDDQTRERLFGEDWPAMWGMRNRIAHGYLLVEAVVVRRTVEVDLPILAGRVREELAEPPEELP